MWTDDYLSREIARLGEALARAFDHGAAGQWEEVEDELSAAYDALLGADRSLFEMVDPQSAARMVGSPVRLRALSRLSRADADLSRQRGDHAHARRCIARARTLLTTAMEAGRAADDENELAALDRAAVETGH